MLPGSAAPLTRVQLRNRLIREAYPFLERVAKKRRIAVSATAAAMTADFLRAAYPHVCDDVTPERVRTLISVRKREPKFSYWITAMRRKEVRKGNGGAIAELRTFPIGRTPLTPVMRWALAVIVLACWYWFIERDKCTRWHDESRLVNYRISKYGSEKRARPIRVCDAWERRGYWRRAFVRGASEARLRDSERSVAADGQNLVKTGS